jgi:hypothetical protein
MVGRRLAAPARRPWALAYIVLYAIGWHWLALRDRAILSYSLTRCRHLRSRRCSQDRKMCLQL